MALYGTQDSWQKFQNDILLLGEKCAELENLKFRFQTSMTIRSPLDNVRIASLLPVSLPLSLQDKNCLAIIPGISVSKTMRAMSKD